MKTFHILRFVLILSLLSTILLTPFTLNLQTARAESTSTCTLNWELVPAPSFPGKAAGLVDMDSSASSDVWAVGTLGNHGAELLILHWDGVAWRRVAAPNLDSGEQSFRAVTAITPTDAWAAGVYDDAGTDRGFVLQWNGLEWRNASVPQAYANRLTEIDSISATEVWAVGAKGSNAALIHWNGTTWLDLSNEIESFGFVELDDIIAHSATDIYITGTLYEDDQRYAGVAHWNGSAWTLPARIELEEIPGPGHVLIEVPVGFAAFSSVDLWMALQTTSNKSSPHYRIIHWTGTAWQTIEQGVWLYDLKGFTPANLYALVTDFAQPPRNARHW